MKKSTLSFLVALLGVVVATLGIVAGGYDRLWSLIGIAGDQRSLMDTGFSIMVLLGGFLFAGYIQTLDIIQQQTDNRYEIVHKLSAMISDSSAMRVLSSDEALAEISHKIESATSARNTRLIAKDAPSGYSTVGGRAYSEALRRALGNGLLFKDVISGRWLDDCKKTQKAMHGNYECALIKEVTPCTINFLVLDYSGDTHEVYFGWAISPARGFDQACFACADHRVVSFFRELHVDLMSKAQRI